MPGVRASRAAGMSLPRNRPGMPTPRRAFPWCWAAAVPAAWRTSASHWLTRTAMTSVRLVDGRAGRRHLRRAQGAGVCRMGVCARTRARCSVADPSLGRSGLFKGERIIGVLRELIGNCEIADLPLTYTAVATDIESGEALRQRSRRSGRATAGGGKLRAARRSRSGSRTATTS